MDYLCVSLRNCYGIKRFSQTFDFTQKTVYTIYAPNGMMKTSFARAFKDYSEGVPSKDEIFQERITEREITDENNVTIPSDKIFVIEPYNRSYKSEKVSTLLVNNTLRQEYQAILESLDQRLDALMQHVRRLSGIRKEIEPIIALDITSNANDIFIALRRLRDEVSAENYDSIAHIKYNSIFTPKVVQLLSDPNFVSNLVDYTEIYDSLLERSIYFRKGIFNHNNADTIANNLAKNGFFSANHSVNLFSESGTVSVRTVEELREVIQLEKDRILEDEALKAAFEELDKKLSANQELRGFRSYLNEHPDVIPELRNPDLLKQRLWISYLREAQQEFQELMDEYERGKSRIDQIVESARQESTKWARVVEIFNRRFSVPFKLAIQNQEDVILKKDAPNVVFVFVDGSEERSVDEGKLLKVLSNGERRALYLLNTIFEIEARLSSHEETFFIVDDIADSFDYKNKYAIIEYLKDISNTTFFRQIILTHNFDFFRTISSRLDMGRPNKMHCKKGPTEISLVEEKYQNNPFNHWKNNLRAERSMLIASIPFVRNIAEFSGDTVVFESLTSLLHLKSNSNSITMLDLQVIYQQILKDQAGLVLENPTDIVIDAIHDEAGLIMRGVIVDINLENKIVLAIAIRLKCEEYLINRIGDTVFVNSITRNQTFELCNRFKSDFPDEDHVASLLDQVNIMTPENIHLNSFMYEPIVDLADHHLKSLYDRVCNL